MNGRRSLVVDAGPAENLHRGRGIGRAIRELIPALVQAASADPRLQLSVLAARRATIPSAASSLRLRTPVSVWGGVVPWVPYPMARAWRWLDARRWLPHDIRASEASIFLATDPDAVVTVPGVRTVAFLYDLLSMGEERDRPHGTAFTHQAESWRRCAHLIAISEATKAEAIRRLGLPSERISVAHLAVDARFAPHPDAHRRVVARWGQTRPYVLYVGGFDPHKNVEAVLRAFASEQVPPELDLVVVGSLAGPGARLRTRHPSPRIRWLGTVTDEALVALYGAAMALVIPSRTEGFGLPALEAMRCGVPVIAAPVGALPEVCGEAPCWVIEPTTAALAQGVQCLWHDEALRAWHRAAGLRHAARFTWAATATAVLDACERIMPPDTGDAVASPQL